MLSVVTFRGSSYSVRGLIVMLASTLLLVSICMNLSANKISYKNRQTIRFKVTKSDV
jgi:hypothetical protein